MSHLFDPEELHGLVRQAIGQPLPAIIAELRQELSARYPGHILQSERWIFNNAGGAMGQMLLLHASLTEYLMIFGSPIGTEGHSGRFYAEDFFFILEGEQWAYAEGDIDKRVYRPGDLHVLKPGTAEGYRMPDRCFALEYARGIIPAMLPFGFADAVSSTLDLSAVGRTVGVYTRGVVGNLLRGKV
ncbi:MAG: ERG2 family protein [Sandaracinaceae bacterium]